MREPAPITARDRERRRAERACARAARARAARAPLSSSAAPALALWAALALLSCGALFFSGGGGAAPTPAVAPAGEAGESRYEPKAAPSRPERSQPNEGARLPQGPDELLEIYQAAAAHYGIDWKVLAASGYSETVHGTYPAPGVRSADGATSCCRGVMAICVEPSCGSVWEIYGTDGDSDGVADPYTPADSIWAAAEIYSEREKMYGGDRALMWASYNAGEGAVADYGGVPPFEETQHYVERCEAYYQKLRALG